MPPPEVAAKKPWAWLTPADPVEAPILDPLPETETPVQAVEDQSLPPNASHGEKFPLKNFLPLPRSPSLNPKQLRRNPRPLLRNRNWHGLNPKQLRRNPRQLQRKPELAWLEPEITSPEPEAVIAEPELAWLEPEAEPVAVLPELAMAEPEVAFPEPSAVEAEPGAGSG